MEEQQVDKGLNALLKYVENLTEPPSPIIVSMLHKYGYTDEQIAAKMTKMAQLAEFQELKLKDVAEKYALDIATTSKHKLRELLEVEDEHLSYCQRCNGKECAKKKMQYWVPAPERWKGDIYIRWGPCIVERMRRADARLKKDYRGKTFADYKLFEHLRPKDVEAVQQSIELAKQVIADGKTSLYLYGVPGAGKSLLAWLIGKSFMIKGRSVEGGLVEDILDELKDTFDDKTQKESDVLKKFLNCDLLVLDDVGAEHQTDWKIKTLFRLIDERVNNHKQLVITSNYSPDELYDELAKVNRVKAWQLMDRIESICEFGYVGSFSVRKYLRKGCA